MIATILSQKLNPTAPGILYTFFALVAFIGIMISTQIHHDETPNSNNNDATGATFEQELPDGEPTKLSDDAVSTGKESVEANRIV